MRWWLHTLLWRLAHPGSAACQRCISWRRRNPDTGICYRHHRIVFGFESCWRFLKKTSSATVK